MNAGAGPAAFRRASAVALGAVVGLVSCRQGARQPVTADLHRSRVVPRTQRIHRWSLCDLARTTLWLQRPASVALVVLNTRVVAKQPSVTQDRPGRRDAIVSSIPQHRLPGFHETFGEVSGSDTVLLPPV